MGPWKLVGPRGVYSWPWPQPATVLEPLLPARRVVFLGPWMAVFTFCNLMFSRMRLPLEKVEEFAPRAVRIPMGVLEIVLSSRVTEPTVCADGPPDERLKPTPHLSIEMDLYVQPEWRLSVIHQGFEDRGRIYPSPRFG